MVVGAAVGGAGGRGTATTGGAGGAELTLTAVGNKCGVDIVALAGSCWAFSEPYLNILCLLYGVEVNGESKFFCFFFCSVNGQRLGKKNPVPPGTFN